MSRTILVERSPVDVLYVRADGRTAVAAALAHLRRVLERTRRRRFFAWAVGREFRACVERREQDDAAGAGLEAARLPGGLYARARHVGPYPLIGDTFAALRRGHVVDPARGEVEEHFGGGDVYALLPILR